MEFGLDKFREPHLNRGVVNTELGLEDQALIDIDTITNDDSYKYLSILQLMGRCPTAIYLFTNYIPRELIGPFKG